jgi:hypothetical protein
VGTRKEDLARLIYVGTTVQSVALVGASLLAGRLSDRIGR